MCFWEGSAFRHTYKIFTKTHGPDKSLSLITSQARSAAVKTLVATILVALCLLGFAFSMPVDGSYTFTIIDDPTADTLNGERTIATGINASGEIVGNVIGNHGGYGFVYRRGVFTTIKVPGAAYTLPTGINARREIVGTFSDDVGEHGFLYAEGVFTKIDAPGAGIPNHPGATRANGINAGGEIVGDFDVCTNVGCLTSGYIYRAGVFTILDFSVQAFGINNGGDIVGDGGDFDGFLYTRGLFTAIRDPNAVAPGIGGSGSILTTATAINDAGQIVGLFTDVGGYRGFVYERGKFTTLPLPPGAGTPNIPLGINNAGHIVGYFNGVINGAGGNHGFLATPTH
jgi:probable HAF family extracellular repeat protein